MKEILIGLKYLSCISLFILFMLHMYLKFPVYFGIVTLLMIIVVIALILGWAIKSIRGDYD
ncbi:hypothetical protein P4571_07990 [Niallia alba]|uniref:hypothetical protein n=1 Tax=Niallia alba TaxID=2729105 RepID=UPI002E20DEF7|nr:hypothetical protein [Niallia alba]